MTAFWRRRVADTVERLDRLLDVALTPGAAPALLLWRPFSVSAFRLVSGLAQEGLSFASVIDVGANIGQFSRAVLGLWPRAHVIAFEPLPSCAAELERALEGSGRVEVHRTALGSTDGSLEFHPHHYTLASSALPATEAAKDQFDWAREQPPVDVPVRRLDSVLAKRSLPRPTLLKLDVQGYELEVLAGATGVLSRVDAVLVEAAFEPSYKRQPLFGEVHACLASQRWDLVRPLDARRESGRIVEVDCLYRPAARIV